MNTEERNAYLAFLDKWFRINPESIISFKEETEVDEEVVVNEEKTN